MANFAGTSWVKVQARESGSKSSVPRMPSVLMRIGVDACCWSNRRGFGRFTRELLQALVGTDWKMGYFFFVDGYTADSCDLPSPAKKILVKTTVSPTQAASASGRRSLADLWAFSREFLKHSLDFFFFPAVYSYFPI